MDLVSSTLDKYLKNRFNGNGQDTLVANVVRHDTTNINMTVQTTTPKIHKDQTNTTTANDLPQSPLPVTNLNSFVQSQSINNNFDPAQLPFQDTKPNQLIIQNQPHKLNSNSNNIFNSTTNKNNANNNTDTNTTTLINNIVNAATTTTNTTTNTTTTTTTIPNSNNKNNSLNHVNLCNGINNDDNNQSCNHQMPSIHKISISNVRPCCIAIRQDLHFIAAGFENSHIYLWKIQDRTTLKLENDSMSKLLAHSGAVYCLEFVDNNNNPDLMLSCSEDSTIRLWCLKTKCNVMIYRGHSYPIWSINVGPQGKLFASASMDATARLWQLDRIIPLKIFCGHDDDVECVKFHPNEKYIATGSSDATVRLWSISDAKMVRLMVGHENPITSLSFLPNGKFLASASTDGTIKLWNLATNSVKRELSIPPSSTIAFSPEQMFISSCGIDNILRIWQLDDNDIIERKRVVVEKRTACLLQSEFYDEHRLFVIEFSYEIISK